MIYGAHDKVLDYADLISVHRPGIRYKMGRCSVIYFKDFPYDDILESLYKMRIRESDQLKTVLVLHDTEIHQKTPVLSYQ